MGSIDIAEKDGIILVTMTGPMSTDLVADMRERLLPLVQASEKPRILYDSRKVEIVGDDRITRAFRAVDEEIIPKTAKIASVTADYTIATRVGQIHLYSAHHERFYDFESAEQWLRMD